MQCISSTEKALQSISSEIIVVDNNSQDESCQWVKTHFPNVQLIQNKENLGFSKGNNIGVNIAKGKYICLLNPDTIVGENVFSCLLNFAEQHQDLGIVAPQLIDGTGNFLPESKRNIPTPKIAFQKLLKINKNYYSKLAEEETGKVDILVGAFMLMQKSKYKAVGMLDEDYFMYGEDIDLSYKFLKAGYQNYYIGSQKVLHYKGESTLKDKKYRERFYGAMDIFYQKHFQRARILNPLIKLLLQLAKFLHAKTPTKNKTVNCKEIYWVSDRPVLERISNKLKKEIIHISRDELNKLEIKNSQLIFDAKSMEYQEIFSIMTNLKINQNYFRIKPVNFNFTVGSDDSRSQGSVLNFDY
ncbi:Glycosyltransferase, GT2 family [Mesonia phycicola]|uniref:Glycosyltransferase, GT2 family n=2 Tax=Mesonia phycicola TaxID=579105 RepID=A0A1M6A8D4_9FLAO|nr:Glycosyltransferase, GT2 family [Mesonia phycicola]